MSAKTRLKETLEKVGRTLDDETDFRRRERADGQWESTVTVSLPGMVDVVRTGAAWRRRDADARACAAALDTLDLPVLDWSRWRRDAQAGDALLKLAAYLAADLGSVGEVSLWLQGAERNRALASVFDRWHADGHEDLRIFGPGLGEEARATVVEAIIWRRYCERVLREGALDALARLRGELTRVSGA
ncbi:MAG: hypothetical protein ACOZNI_07910 [Myxococcota bacterium]